MISKPFEFVFNYLMRRIASCSSCNNSNSNNNDINLIIENERRLKSLGKFELVKELSTYDVQYLKERVSRAVLCLKEK